MTKILKIRQKVNRRDITVQTAVVFAFDLVHIADLIL